MFWLRNIKNSVTHSYLGACNYVFMANSADPDEILYFAASYLESSLSVDVPCIDDSFQQCQAIWFSSF